MQQTAIHHEAADIIMTFIMIQEALSGSSPLRVVSDDTDVLLLLAHHLYHRINGLPSTTELSMESCSYRPTMISVNDIDVKHAAIMPNILAAHALTGCDTVSSFARISKTSVLKKLQTHTPTLRLGDLSSTQHDITESCTQLKHQTRK